ncbi:glycoside hydrolase family 19 protein [Terriglobus sp. RCC_193]|uniref:glycoside hydrolase family 19 protein n=1 Tax=Terriglobus sp. RCC_193 TaxID=3239218 RepID=UPI00352582A3
MHHAQVTGPLVADGVCGAATIALIEQFQQGVIGGNDTVGLVTPDSSTATHGSTLRALRSSMPPGFIEEKLEGILIHAAAADTARFFAPMLAAMQSASIDTALRQAHFLAQAGHESAELHYTEEIASGAAYEGRKDLGNTQPGDGVRFKGRGLMQLTGRSNYAAFGKFAGQDLLKHPELVANNPRLAVDVATWFWTKHDLNPLADADDIRAITHRVNGGENGLDDRKAKLVRAKWFLMDPHPDPALPGLIQAMEAVAFEPFPRHARKHKKRRKAQRRIKKP